MSPHIAGALSAATAALALVLALSFRGPLPRAAGLRHPDALALADADWRGGLRRWEGVRATCITATLVILVLAGLPAPLALLAGAAPSVWIRLRAESARDRARRALGRIFATIEAGLRSGLAAPEALRRAADSGDALAARPLREALRAFELGAGLDASLAAAAARLADEHTRVALGSVALGISERLPRERLADLVASVSDRVGFEERLADEIDARAAGARQQQRLLALLVPAIAAYLAITMPLLGETLGSEVGRWVIPAAALLEVTGIVLGRRIVRGALA